MAPAQLLTMESFAAAKASAPEGRHLYGQAPVIEDGEIILAQTFACALYIAQRGPAFLVPTGDKAAFSLSLACSAGACVRAHALLA